MTVNEKVSALRELLKKNGLDAWIINGTDPHESEYVCERWKSRRWISGFSGSAGTVVVTQNKAFVWVDSRYFVQCANQIKGTCFEMKKLDGPEGSKPDDWISENVSGKVGISAETLMVEAKRRYEGKGIKITASEDLLDQIWTDRPAMPSTPVVVLSDKLCGESVASKLERIRCGAKKKDADWSLISSLDDIAWTLNLRGSDIDDTPVFLSHLLIGPDCAKLYTPLERFSKINVSAMPFEVFPYEKIREDLGKLENTSVYLNPGRINMKLYGAIGKSVKIVEGREISTNLKACKNSAELEGMRTAHILDGVALVNFLAMVKTGKYSFTELSIAQALANEREQEKDYLGPSFNTIAGFADHGAVVHYGATPETDKEIKGNGLLVLDSGGQYTGGTTDITRTLLFGRPTKEQIKDYTLVLKGHLALAAQVFPKGTNGHQLDILAHMFLWNNGMTYFHGTGHGVGFRLSVHEGPQRISAHTSAAEVPLEVGMVLSDEPGVYKEGKHGIRIENLIAVVPAFENEFGAFYTFETLTCCPYERALIDKSLLTAEEVDLVNTYHAWVYEKLCKLVNKEALSYLEEATKPL